jgi:hypothetical protein
MEFRSKESVNHFFEGLSKFVAEDIDLYLLGGCAFGIHPFKAN